jgi:hypothetical protein
LARRVWLFDTAIPMLARAIKPDAPTRPAHLNAGGASERNPNYDEKKFEATQP